MNTTESMVRLAGALHFAVLIASALVPRALDWKRNLSLLHPFLRKLFWVYGVFIVLTIISFGLLAVFFPSRLASDDSLGRAIAGVIAIFWLARLSVQFFVFDPEPFLTNWFYKVGYHTLTLVFILFVIVFGSAALGFRL